MTIILKNLSVGSLPYEKIDLATRMMVKFYEQSPFLAFLPNVDSNDNIINFTFAKNSYFNIVDRKISFNFDLSDIDKISARFQKILRAPHDCNLDEFAAESFFLERYFKIINRIQPKETIIPLFGPFSSLALINDYDRSFLITNKDTRKFLIQYFTLKSIYFINKIKKISPETRVIILFDEPALKHFYKLKLLNEKIDDSTIITIYKRVFKKIQDLGGLVGLQCFGKCNWSLAIDSNVNLISFDGYNNPNNLNIIAPKVNAFLSNGGYINWGFVPVDNERQIKSLNIDKLLHKFVATTDLLIKQGVSANLLFSHSLISTLGDMANLPVIFAEKAIIVSNRLSQVVPTLK